MSRVNGKRGSREGPEYTGRTLVLMADESGESAVKELENRAGIRALRSRDLGGATMLEIGTGSVVFEELGVALIDADPEQNVRIAGAIPDQASSIIDSEPERVVYAISMQSSEILPANGHARPSTQNSSPPLLMLPEALPSPALGEAQDLREFLRGYREAVCHLEALFAGASNASTASEQLVQRESPLAGDATWGLYATKVMGSKFSGKGIRVAILDTGFDLRHPDFAGRTVVAASFVPGEEVQDGHGHGTHCIGTACGPRMPAAGVARYGVAHEAEIYAGKVLSDEGSGSDGGILAGIDWAVKNKVAVVSMSLGAPTSPGASPSRIFETTARRAAAKGTLIIAASGNSSARPGHVAPVGHPANCPSIVAVAALDESLRVASFSCGGVTAGGGEVNIAGPGVGVLSSWPTPTRYRTLDGTSMATPHVAGIAALYAEATGLRGFDLINAMLRRSRRLTPVRDFGWGLVQSV